MDQAHRACPRDRRSGPLASNDVPPRWRSIGELAAEIVEKLAAQRAREAAE